MRFIRIVDGSQAHFCVVDEKGAIRKLNEQPDDPQDYLELYEQASAQDRSITDYAGSLAATRAPSAWDYDGLNVPPSTERPYLGLPYAPPEVWGAAFTYVSVAKRNKVDPFAEERQAERPVIFFKATASRCVGPNDAIGSRADATAMIPEPELAVILSASGTVIGYTIANDVSSRDLPRENPLYVCYSKTFDRCLSFGPAIVAPETIPDATNVDIRCRVTRDGEVLWDETGNTKYMYRSIDDLIAHTIAHNSMPIGTIFATGTALSPPQDMHIVEGDLVEIEIPAIGRLVNPVVQV